MKYLLDTDHISFLQRRPAPEHATLTARISRYAAEDFAFSIVSFHEQTLGANALIARTKKPAEVIRGYTLFREILQGFTEAPVLPFDVTASNVFDDLRTRQIRVATMDMRIAAIALSRGLILLTRNRSDFGKIPGLTIEDWTE